MKKIGRNDQCPCGSGKKFKKCHMGREAELNLDSLDEMSVEEMGEKIVSLPVVDYGRSKEILDSLDIKQLTGKKFGIKFVDLKSYLAFNLFSGPYKSKERPSEGGIFINLYKTRDADPDNIYLAISKDIDDSTLIHELAHVLDYLGGSELMPGTLEPLAMELEIPVEHLEHTEDYGSWLKRMRDQFDIQLDADDTIVSYLHDKGLLIRSKDVRGKNGFILKSKSNRILTFMSENSEEIDALIKDRSGYIGAGKKDSE